MNRIRSAAAIVSLITLFGCGKNYKTDDPTVTIPVTSQLVTETSASAPQVSTTAQAQTSQATTSSAPPKDLFIRCRDTVEVYEELKMSDFITDANVELAEPDAIVNTSELGESNVTVKYLSGGNSFETKLSYKVIDSTPPVVLNSGWSPNHIVNTAFDLNDYVGFADNYDRTPTLTYSGNIDPNTIGSYPITATVTDSSGNSQSWELTVNVCASKPQNVDNAPRVNFSDFTKRYSGEGLRYGIDVSTWQGDVDFNAVKNAGCSFVIIRMGHYYGTTKTDDYYSSNFRKAKEAGLDVGVYFYTTDNSEAGARERADWIAEQLGGEKLELPVAFDWEEFGSFQEYKMSIHDLNQYYLAFSDQMSKHGYTTMLYSSKNFLNNFWSESTKAATPVWLAHFVDETDYAGDYAIWQASCYGRIPGINGDVDMNILYKPLPLE